MRGTFQVQNIKKRKTFSISSTSAAKLEILIYVFKKQRKKQQQKECTESWPQIMNM